MTRPAARKHVHDTWLTEYSMAAHTNTKDPPTFKAKVVVMMMRKEMKSPPNSTNRTRRQKHP
jgi:hypothetical protein